MTDARCHDFSFWSSAVPDRALSGRSALELAGLGALATPLAHPSAAAFKAAVRAAATPVSIPKTNPQRSGRLNQIAVGRDGAQAADSFRYLYRHRIGRFHGNHVTIHPVGNELDRAGAKACAQEPVKGRRTTAALEVPQNADAGFLTSAFLNLRRHDAADAPQEFLPIGAGLPGGHEPLVRFARAFRHNHESELLALLFALEDFGADRLIRERNLRNQNY